MTTDDRERERLARLENEAENLKDRVKSLEGNQKWGVLAVLSLVIKALADFISRGSP